MGTFMSQVSALLLPLQVLGWVLTARQLHRAVGLRDEVFHVLAGYSAFDRDVVEALEMVKSEEGQG